MPKKKKKKYDPDIDKAKKMHREEQNHKYFLELIKCDGWKYYTELLKERIRGNIKQLRIESPTPGAEVNHMVTIGKLQQTIKDLEDFIKYPRDMIENAEKYFTEIKEVNSELKTSGLKTHVKTHESRKI